MNCAHIAAATGWHCQEVGHQALRIHAPARFGSDGEHLSFLLLEEGANRFYLTDAHATVEHVVSMGVKLSPNRLRSIQQLPGHRFANITENWEITAGGSFDKLQPAIWEATALAMAIASKEAEWQPRSHQERFNSKIQKALLKRLGPERVVLKCRLAGISGHQLEFPLGIVKERFTQAVQPIGLAEDGKPDWGFVYQCFGKFSDLKYLSDEGADNRLIIMEASNTEDWKQAASMLANSARVIAFHTESDLALAA